MNRIKKLGSNCANDPANLQPNRLKCEMWNLTRSIKLPPEMVEHDDISENQSKGLRRPKLPQHRFIKGIKQFQRRLQKVDVGCWEVLKIQTDGTVYIQTEHLGLCVYSGLEGPGQFYIQETAANICREKGLPLILTKKRI